MLLGAALTCAAFPALALLLGIELTDVAAGAALPLASVPADVATDAALPALLAGALLLLL